MTQEDNFTLNFWKEFYNKQIYDNKTNINLQSHPTADLLSFSGQIAFSLYKLFANFSTPCILSSVPLPVSKWSPLLFDRRKERGSHSASFHQSCKPICILILLSVLSLSLEVSLITSKPNFSIWASNLHLPALSRTSTHTTGYYFFFLYIQIFSFRCLH